MQMGLQLLLTNESSMGKGGGDLNCGVPMQERISKIVNKAIGRWKNCAIVWIGDYCEDDSATQATENCTNISEDVAAAVYATIVHLDRALEIPLGKFGVAELLRKYDILDEDALKAVADSQSEQKAKDDKIEYLESLLRAREAQLNRFMPGAADDIRTIAAPKRKKPDSDDGDYLSSSAEKKGKWQPGSRGRKPNWYKELEASSG